MEYGIATLESEFLANIVLPDGGTVGQWPAPQVDEAYATGKDAVDAVRGNCVSPSSRNLADVAQGVGRQHQVGVQRHGGLLWPNHAETALTFSPDCNQCRAQLWRKL